MRLGSLSNPPAPATSPRLTSGRPNLASSLATTRSQASTSSNPPASAYPSTAAITGLAGGFSTIPPKPRPAAIGASPARKPLRSIPALKVPPAPVSTRTLTSARLSKSSIAAAMPRATSPLTAFRACGLSIVMTAMLSATSVRIASATVAPPERAGYERSGGSADLTDRSHCWREPAVEPRAHQSLIADHPWSGEVVNNCLTAGGMVGQCRRDRWNCRTLREPAWPRSRRAGLGVGAERGGVHWHPQRRVHARWPGIRRGRLQHQERGQLRLPTYRVPVERWSASDPWYRQPVARTVVSGSKGASTPGAVTQPSSSRSEPPSGHCAPTMRSSAPPWCLTWRTSRRQLKLAIGYAWLNNGKLVATYPLTRFGLSPAPLLREG